MSDPATIRVWHESRFRLADVVATTHVTPHLIRVTIGGEQLRGFASVGFDDHIKVFVPSEGEVLNELPTLGPEGPVFDKVVQPATRGPVAGSKLARIASSTPASAATARESPIARPNTWRLCPWIKTVVVDGGYKRRSIETVQATADRVLGVVKRPEFAKGFLLLPKPWRVEQSIGADDFPPPQVKL